MKNILLFILFTYVFASLNNFAGQKYCALEVKLNKPLPDDVFFHVTSADWKKPLTIEEFDELQKGLSNTRYYYDIPAQTSGQNRITIVPFKRRGWFTFGYPLAKEQSFLAEADQTYMKLIEITKNKAKGDIKTLGNADFTFDLDYNYDADGDGFGSEQEILYKTNPWNADTDYENLNDFQDVNGVDITIKLPNETNTINTVATDPLNPDTDGDGVLDGVEVYGLSPYGFITDPCNPDTDGDWVVDGSDPNPLGMSDVNGDGVADEWVMFWTNQVVKWGFSINPADLLDGGGDADGDGILNSNEFFNGTIPIVSNGYYELRLIPSPVIITAEVDKVVSAEFSVVDLSFQSTTGEVSQLSQNWGGEISAYPENLSLKYISSNDWYRADLPARFYLRFGMINIFRIEVNTTNLNENTRYYDKFTISNAGVTNEFEIILQTGSGTVINHAPKGVTLLSPSNGVDVISVRGNHLLWEKATDEDIGDIVSNEVRCSSFHYDLPPDIMISNYYETNTLAFAFEEGLTNRLKYGRIYDWQIIARDKHGAEAISPVWSFTTPPNNPTSFLEIANTAMWFDDYNISREVIISNIGSGEFDWEINKTDEQVQFLNINPEKGICEAAVDAGQTIELTPTWTNAIFEQNYEFSSPL